MKKLGFKSLLNFPYPEYYQYQYNNYKPGIKVCVVGTWGFLIYSCINLYNLTNLIFLIFMTFQLLLWNKMSRRAFENIYFMISLVYIGLKFQEISELPTVRVLLIPQLFRGMFYGTVTSVLIFTQPQLIQSALMGLGFIILRIIFFQTLSPTLLYLSISMDFLVIVYRVFFEISKRQTFMELKENNDFLKNFKLIIEKHLPSGMAILAPTSDKILFANECLKNLLNSKTDNDLIENFQRIKRSDQVSERSTLLTESENLPTERQNINQNGIIPLSFENSTKFNCNLFDSEKNKNLNLEAFAFPILWEGENTTGLFFTDLTHQIENTELKISNQNKEMAISTVAHELRNPLSGILGIVELVDEHILPEKVKKRITTVKTMMKYLLNLLNSILDLQQMKNNKLKLNLCSFSLSELLEVIQNIFEFQCKERSIYFHLEYHGISPDYSIISDKERLAQILINLCANAIKFTLQGGITLSVKLIPESRSIQFKVSDSGVGISSSDMTRLFQAFGKIESSSSMNKNGVGLGLMISNSLVKVLNSNDQDRTIKVESEVGVGSSFYFDLDMVCEESEKDFNRVGYEFEKSFKNNLYHSEYMASPLLRKDSSHFYRPSCEFLLMKDLVIIADDNPFNTIALKHYVEKYGYKCATVLNGKEAINLAKKRSENIFKVFMDVEMPVMSGIEATQKLLALMEEGTIPRFDIIGLSGHDDETTIKSCLDAGMKGYMKRPFNVKDLEEFLKNY